MALILFMAEKAPHGVGRGLDNPLIGKRRLIAAHVAHYDGIDGQRALSLCVAQRIHVQAFAVAFGAQITKGGHSRILRDAVSRFLPVIVYRLAFSARSADNRKRGSFHGVPPFGSGLVLRLAAPFPLVM